MKRLQGAGVLHRGRRVCERVALVALLAVASLGAAAAPAHAAKPASKRTESGKKTEAGKAGKKAEPNKKTDAAKKADPSKRRAGSGKKHEGRKKVRPEAEAAAEPPESEAEARDEGTDASNASAASESSGASPETDPPAEPPASRGESASSVAATQTRAAPPPKSSPAPASVPTASSAASASPSAGTSSERPASRADTSAETVDGAGRCEALVRRNALDQRVFANGAPANEEPTPSHASYFFRNFTKEPALLVATLLPHLNAALRGSTPAPGLSFPWTYPLGPAMSCSRERGTFDVAQHWPLRLLLEPGILVEDERVTFFARPGARFVHHPSDWLVGVGGGLGAFFEFGAPAEPRARVALSPELLFQFGACCQPGYVTLAFRREFFFGGDSQLWFATVGFTYF